MTIANFDPFHGHTKTLPSTLPLKRKVAQPLTILMLSTLSLNTAHAALTATTAQTIKGTAPGLSFDGVNRASDLTELFKITLSDAV